MLLCAGTYPKPTPGPVLLMAATVATIIFLVSCHSLIHNSFFPPPPPQSYKHSCKSLEHCKAEQQGENRRYVFCFIGNEALIMTTQEEELMITQGMSSTNMEGLIQEVQVTTGIPFLSLYSLV